MISIWTDGSCLGNPGPGGWAFTSPGHLSNSGYEPDTTNNRMELQAIIEALKWANTVYPEVHIKIFSDSLWSINVLTEKWRPKKNLDLIREAQTLMGNRNPLMAQSPHRIILEWVKGHSTSPQNRIADYLANEAARRQKIILEIS